MKLKKCFYSVFSVLLLLNYSCGGNGNKNDDSESTSNDEKGFLNSISDAAGSVKQMSKMENYAKEIEETMSILKSSTPTSKEVLKSLLPEKLGAMSRTSFNIGEMSVLDIASGKAEYKDEQSEKGISLEIMDGAGEAASAMASILFLAFQTDRDSEHQDGFEKTIDLDGDRALVKETKYNDEINSEIQWIHKKRYIITLKGNNLSYEELADLKKNLDLGALK